ncbi:MAG TPA: sugar ABC transporter permease [Gaiellaceae bacterium]|nr:sugar ABC transporter permease [Gaiellaceae bacterium]
MPDPIAFGMSSPDAAVLAPPRRTRRRLRLGRLEPLVWLAPALAVIAFVFGYSMVDLVRTALHFEGKWTFENFRVTWSDPTFRTALTHNGRLLLAVPVLVVTALLLSILLFEGLRGWRFHRSALFLPYVLPIPVIGVIFGQLLQLNGLVNQLLRGAGLDGLAQDWLGQPGWALWTMTAVIVWKELGFGIVLFLARLLSVPSDIFEAGRMDGARFWRLHRRITVPQLAGVIVFYVVVEAITMVSWVFNYVYVMTNGQGGPGDATQVTELYIYQTAFQYQSPEIASAAAVTLFAVTLVLIALFFRIQRRAGLGVGEE